MKRILVMGDQHAGHWVGLTPPAWQYRATTCSSTSKHNKWAKIQAELWGEFKRVIRSIAPIDVLFVMGDNIDGKGKRSGGTELITTDLEEQCDMAVAGIDAVRLYGRNKNFKIIGCYGTDYHTSSDGDDWENIVAERANFHKIGSHEWPEVEGVVFDIKHHIGNTSIPHGRGTAITKEQLSNELWAARDDQPRASVILRGHVHRFFHTGDASFLGMTLPATQGMGSKYGARRCSMPVDWGMVHFDVGKGRVLDWREHVISIKSQKAKVTRL